MNLCPECGEPLGTSVTCVNQWKHKAANEWTYVPSVFRSVPLGWKCPECETVYAPWVNKCECCKRKPTVTVSGNSGSWLFETNPPSVEDSIYDEEIEMAKLAKLEAQREQPE